MQTVSLLPSFAAAARRIGAFAALAAALLPARPGAQEAGPVAGTRPADAAVTSAIPVRLETPVQARLRGQILEKDRRDLAALLEGRWDNDVQVFFEPEIGVPAPLRHSRFHVAVRALPSGGFAGPAFYAEHRQGGETGAVVRQQVWVLETDTDADAIILRPHAPRDPAAVAGAHTDPARLALLTPEAVTPVEGCELLVRRRGGGFGGETRPNACRLGVPGDGRSVIVSERHDLSAGVWDVRDIGVDARGNRVFGVPDGSPARFRKARAFTCWARAGGETALGLALHDQGGSARVPGPGTGRIRLRNVDWPVGDNRASLTLYLLDGAGDLASTFAWTDPDSRRIALARTGTEASCTEDPAALWRIGAAPLGPPQAPPAPASVPVPGLGPVPATPPAPAPGPETRR